MLTTADAVGESVCNDEYEYAKSVRDNPGDPNRQGFDMTYLPVIYEALPDDDWTLEEVWRKANPLYDASPTMRSTLRDECRVAKDQPSYTNAFRRWYLNVQTEALSAWLAKWIPNWDDVETCAAPFVPEALKGQRCFAGIDMSATTDLCALVLFFPDSGHVVSFFWVPEEAAKDRDRRNDPLYTRWAKGGHLTLLPGDTVDSTPIRQKMLELRGQFAIQKVAIDRAFAVDTAIWLQGQGFEVEFMPQGWLTMSAPCNQLELLLSKRQLRHGGHPVLRWNATNVKITHNERGGKAPVKPKGAAKIDGVVSLLMAIRLATVEPEQRESLDDVYKSEPIEA